jgi:hypothetical protein
MKPVTFVVTSVLLAPVLGACGGSTTTGPGGSASLERVSGTPGLIVNQDMGRVDYTTFAEAMEKIVIRKYRFSLRRREEQFQTLFYQTVWQLRVPSEEEQARGVLDARHRVVIEGRRAGGVTPAGGSRVYRIVLRVENEVRTRDQRDWHPDSKMDAGVESEMRRMISDFQLEVRTGR